MVFKRALSVSILVAVCFLTSSQTQSKIRHPQAILSEMLAEYENASTYQDDGLLRLIPLDSPPSNSLRSLFPNNKLARKHLSFKIFFSKPRMFRFEWRRFSDKTVQRTSVVSFDGAAAYRWSVDPAFGRGRFTFEKKDSIDWLIESSLKSTGGMVLTVPSLLLDKLAPYTFAKVIGDLTELDHYKDEMVDGELCFVVSGTLHGTPWVLWVGSKTHLLKKIRSFYSIGSFQGSQRSFVAEEIHRNIRINENIPAGTYQYQPRLRPGDLDLTR